MQNVGMNRKQSLQSGIQFLREFKFLEELQLGILCCTISRKSDSRMIVGSVIKNNKYCYEKDKSWINTCIAIEIKNRKRVY